MSKIKSYINLHFIIFIWGFTAVLGALIHLDYFSLTWNRMGLASFFLLLYILINKRERRLLLQFDIKQHLKYLLGGILIALHWMAFFYAIKISNVSITLIAMSSGAFFTSLLEPAFYKRKVYFYEILLGLLILLGLYYVLLIEKIDFSGVFAALIAAFLSGLFTVLNGLYVREQSGVQLSFFQLFYGFLFLTLVLLFTGDLSQLAFPSGIDWLYTILLASLCTAYAFTRSISLMKHISPYTLMLSINLEPVYGIILAVLILGDKEKMSETFYIGGFIILAIIVLNTLIKFKKEQNPEKMLKS